MNHKQLLNNARGALRTSIVMAAAVFALALSACNAEPTAPHEASLQIQGFSQYVTSFEQTSAQYGNPVKVTNLSIQFGKVDNEGDGETGGRGVCEATEGMTPVITISQDAWTSSTEAEREELIYHELGHCVLHKAHVGGINQEGIPASLMNPTKINGSIYSQNKDFYLAGLFAQ